MNILITGAAGFIGSNLADHLVDAGHNVVGLDNFHSGRRENLSGNYPFYECSVGDEQVGEILERHGIEVVCHHAAQIDVRFSIAHKSKDAQINILEGLQMLEHCCAKKVRKVIFSSTGGAIYGEPSESSLPVSEAYLPEPMSAYGVSKWSFEQYLAFYKRLYPLDYTILRYANVYGPRQDPHGEAGVVAVFIQRILQGKKLSVFGDGRQTRDYVFVKDICRANELALTRGDGSTFNIGTGRETSILEMIEALKEVTEKPFEVEHLPARLGEVFRIYLDAQRADKELGWRPEYDFSKGLAETFTYMKQS